MLQLFSDLMPFRFYGCLCAARPFSIALGFNSPRESTKATNDVTHSTRCANHTTVRPFGTFISSAGGAAFGEPRCTLRARAFHAQKDARSEEFLFFCQSKKIVQLTS